VYTYSNIHSVLQVHQNQEVVNVRLIKYHGSN